MAKFLILGNINAITYMEIFPFIKKNKLWLGQSITNGSIKFNVPDNYELNATSCSIDENGNKFIRVKGIVWFTNLNSDYTYRELTLDKKYDADKYNHLLNYDCINVDKVKDIPYDYDGVMAVPITVMFYNPKQFDIIGCPDANVLPLGWSGMTKEFVDLYYSQGGTGQYQVGKRLGYYITRDGKAKIPYKRILIRLKKKMKKFLIIGNGNAVTYKEIFPLIKENKLWLGAGKGMGGKAMEFVVDENIYDATKGNVNRKEDGKCYVGVMMCTWFTNLDHKKRHETLDLYKKYNAEEFPKYDNYDAINVNKVCDIPLDFDGVMGVPISFLDKYCPNQFEIISMMSGAKNEVFVNGNDGRAKFYVDGKGVYARILIKFKK